MKYYDYEETYSHAFRKNKSHCFKQQNKKVKRNHDYYRSNSSKRKLEKENAAEERRLLNERQNWRK